MGCDGVVECASPLALWFSRLRFEKRQRAGAVQNLAAIEQFMEGVAAFLSVSIRDIRG
jgi:hypothetical protein